MIAAEGSKSDNLKYSREMYHFNSMQYIASMVKTQYIYYRLKRNNLGSNVKSNFKSGLLNVFARNLREKSVFFYIQLVEIQITSNSFLRCII